MIKLRIVLPFTFRGIKVKVKLIKQASVFLKESVKETQTTSAILLITRVTI